ncbi:MAG: hypothetical protein IJC52_03755 [Clostridia bacterium]|nr:hypothetical protein [Clostridia bacterium]
MNPTVTAITHDLRAVNERIKTDAAAFVAAQEAAYDRQIERVAEEIAPRVHGFQPILQCGPSSVGKTTTANRLVAALEVRGVQALTVSLDNFYRGKGLAPQLPDGSYDYESPEALDLARLATCVRELVQTGQTQLPRYDFGAGVPAAETTLMHLSGDTAVIFEGVHAFTPSVQAAFDGASAPLHLYVNTRSRFTDGDEVLLGRRDIRLSRRLLRDERTRACGFAGTMAMWEQVLRGEDLYIAPHRLCREYIIDTTMDYEPCVLAPRLLPKLKELYGTPYEQKAREFERVYARFEPLATALIPHTSVLREFIGHDD